jgi:hypothetical protein
MRFPNAYKGVSKLFLAEILSLIASIVGVIAGVLALGVVAMEEVDPSAVTDGVIAVGAGSAIIALVAGIVMIIAFVLTLVGLVQAKKDDDGFKLALIFALICIVLSIVSSILTSVNPYVSGWMSFVVTIFELCVFEYVVIGIMSLSNQLGDQGMVSFGAKVRMLISILYIILLIIRLFGNINVAFAGVVSIIGAILELVVYIGYLIYLAKAKKMLAK